MDQIIALSTIEQTKLTDLESIIETGLKTFYEVGNALAQIREERLYRVDFTTFEDYCRERWQMSRAYAYRMIGAAEVVDNLSPIGDTNPPANEAQARPLTGLDPELQREAWLKASGSTEGGRVTAKQVQTAVDEVTKNWKPVWELQMSVGDWARAKYGESEYGLERLNTLKQLKDNDSLWDEVVATLPTPHRKRDVIQAINNVVDIWQQRAEKRQAQESPELTCAGQVRHWMRYRGLDADGLLYMVDKPHENTSLWGNLMEIKPPGKTRDDMEYGVLQVMAKDFDILRLRVNYPVCPDCGAEMRDGICFYCENEPPAVLNEEQTATSGQTAGVPYADYLDAQIKATDAEMEQLLADGLPEREPLGLLDDEPLEISTIDNGLKQIEWLITELLANVRGAGYISVLGKLAEANMAILDARKLLKDVMA